MGPEEYRTFAERFWRAAREAESLGGQVRLAMLADQFEEAARYFERERQTRQPGITLTP
jgi:hypothetical protein